MKVFLFLNTGFQLTPPRYLVEGPNFLKMKYISAKINKVNLVSVKMILQIMKAVGTPEVHAYCT